MFKLIISSLTILFFLSCGNNGSQHEPLEEKTLYLKAPVIDGIDYSCGERKGISKAYTKDGVTTHGVIKCIYSPVYLTLGSLNIGTIKSFVNEQEIFPQDLIPSFDGDFNNEKLLKLAILLNAFKNEKDYVNISEEIKDNIPIKSLDELSIEELIERIVKLGIAPMTAEEARIELLLNAGGKNIGRPNIKPFEEEISTSLNIGSTIGRLSMDEGDSKLITPLTLDGIGKENFIVNQNGTIKLAKMIDSPKTYNLTVMAMNQFGYTKESITLHIKDSSKIGKAQMGRLSGATVTIHKLNPDNSKDLVYTNVTKSEGSLNIVGNFELQDDTLDDEFYIYEINGGVDIDSDSNGERDKKSMENRGKLRLITKGIWVKNATHKIRVTPLSEMLYTYVEGCKYNELEKKLNSYSKILLKKSLDFYDGVDVKDIMIFDPLRDKDKLYNTLTYNSIYSKITDKIRAGDIGYKKTLFSAFTVDSYSANAVEIVGSYVYTIDMMGSGEFRIYDLETRELVGSLKLPNTPVSENSHVLYVNLLKNTVIIGSLTNWSYLIDIKNHKKPVLINKPYMTYSILSGNFSRRAIGKSFTANLLTKDRKFYYYDISSNSNKTQKIKTFKMNKERYEYLYELDSKLYTIDSLWTHNDFLYIVGDSKIHLFKKNKNSKMELKSICNRIEIKGNIIGIEEDILYIMSGKKLTLINVKLADNPKFIEKLDVPFRYKLGVKTNGKYISTDSQTIDINALKASIRK